MVGVFADQRPVVEVCAQGGDAVDGVYEADGGSGADEDQAPSDETAVGSASPAEAQQRRTEEGRAEVGGPDDAVREDRGVIGVVREEVLRLMGLGRGEEARGQEDDRDDRDGHVKSGGTYPGLRFGHVGDEGEDRGRRDGSADVLDQERQVGDVQILVDC